VSREVKITRKVRVELLANDFDIKKLHTIDTVLITFDLTLTCDAGTGLFTIQGLDASGAFYQFILNLDVPLGGAGLDTSDCANPGIMFTGGSASPSKP